MKNEYDKLLEVLFFNSEEKENALEDIFAATEENLGENTKTEVSVLRYFLPKKVREEFIGDMYELVAEMENEKRKKRFIWSVIILQYVFVMFGQVKSIFKITINKEISDK